MTEYDSYDSSVMRELILDPTPEPESVVMTDGGSAACPDCAGSTVNGQGLYDCLDCDWSGLR